MATHPSFKPWELKDNMTRVKVELAMRDPSTLALDMLHKAAFRETGLGNSIFVANHNIGKISTSLVAITTFLYILQQNSILKSSKEEISVIHL